MVNGNYVLYGDRPVSESEIVDDHVHTRTPERKIKRKAHRTANELQHSLNMAQLDNETDSIKYEKRIKEPRLLRYVPTTDVEENFVSEKFETYDLKPTQERPRRYAFTKKPKNPADGSVNYAYSRSSSSCSSPNGNLPTISEHGEQYGTYRVRPALTPAVHDDFTGYENKLDKYFTKPREVKKFAAKGSHPDSLYRVPVDSGTGTSKLGRVLRFLRWPAALILVCIALAVFVYFLMPDNIESDTANSTYWESFAFEASHSQRALNKSTHNQSPPDLSRPKEKKKSTQTQGTRITEIDFYNAENDKNDLSSSISTAPTVPVRKLPIPPVFPSHITPEVQYGNERADTDKLRSPKILDEKNEVPEDSTLKPHITQKPEKPLAIYFKEGTAITNPSTETIYKAETNNDFTNYGEKLTTKKVNEPMIRPHYPVYKDEGVPTNSEVVHSGGSNNRPLEFVREPELPELLEVYNHQPIRVVVNGANDSKFTSGHSKLFGISIEDAEKMRSTTQSSLYNTRVSPTLPTWRDGDDTTTKKYPVNVNSDVPQCRSTRLALCRGVLPYDLAGPAATINGVEVTALLSQIEYLVATNCSDRVRHFACALLEPECNPPPYPSKPPCYNLCKAVVDSCDGLIPGELSSTFRCEQYSNKNCVTARRPCFPRELGCSDGSCVPRDWICDGTTDCPAGEDEESCALCDLNEYRCRSGGCILKRWLCDGYADCPGGEDEAEDTCEARTHRVEPGEESAGSAPAPAVRRPYRMPTSQVTGDVHKTGENDNSKELLITSDSNNALKRNFTRRPSPSRLTPYSRPMLHAKPKVTSEDVIEPKKIAPRKSPAPKTNLQKSKATAVNIHDEDEDVKIDDLFFEDLEKETKEQVDMKQKEKSSYPQRHYGTAPDPPERPISPTRINKAMVERKNALDRVVNGAEMMRKAIQEEETEITPDSPETNSTNIDNDDVLSMGGPGAISAHASPCPGGELRCVDGRCITLAQLCDGTIDCTDHADEDNCYT